MLIAEKLLLLGLDPAKGKVVYPAQSALNFGLAGAILMDLVLMERITIHKGKVIITNAHDVDDPILHDVLVSLAKAKIDEMVKGEAIGKAVKDTVAATNAAIVSAIAAASVASSSSSGSA